MGFSCESLLCEGRIDAHGDQFNHLIEALIFFAQIVSLLFAHWGVERGHDADDPDLTLALGVGEGDGERSVCVSVTSLRASPTLMPVPDRHRGLPLKRTVRPSPATALPSVTV